MGTTSRLRVRTWLLLLYMTLASVSLTHCDADRSMRLLKIPKHRGSIIVLPKNSKKLRMTKKFDVNSNIHSSNAQPYSISSPLSLPPYESLPPFDNSPPYCVYPPPSRGTPGTGSQSSPPDSSSSMSPPYYYISPIFPSQSPPPSPISITPGPPGIFPTPTPEIVPSPPDNTPGSPEPILNPPIIMPGPPGSSMSPPYYEPSPPFSIPSPGGGGSGGGGGGVIPSPPTIYPSPSGGTIPSPFQPPIVYPPPSVPPPPNTAPVTALWCVAKASVPDPIIQEAMNYACWSGADCASIQPNGPCYEPDTVFAHASYAFNSYWQRTKGAGGTCEFGGTAILVAVDPSYNGCHFIFN